MNKYLEKIANWHEVEPGLHYDYSSGRYHISQDKENSINSTLDKRHVTAGAKVFGGLGAVGLGGLGLAVGERSIFGAPRNLSHRLSRGLRGAIIGGGLGAATGALLAQGGNNQVHASGRTLERRLHSEIASRAGDYRRTTAYQMLNGD
jgi:hypothetical protein